jgi:SAM-dependent methyltransferase
MALANDKPNRLAVDALNLAPRESVLELGFGPGWGLRNIAARTGGARVYGVDQSARMLEQARHMNEMAVSSGRMVLVQGPFSPLPWIDEMFDKVLLVNVVYFFDSDGRDMSEVHRVLRSGGHAVIYVTSRESMAKWPFAGSETHKLYDHNELLDFLVDAGFQPSDIVIENVRLPFGIKGLLATAVKSCAAKSGFSPRGQPRRLFPECGGFSA